MAGWSHEIPPDGFLARTIINRPLVLWRDMSGTAIAFDDRCCHRAAPLSKGRREGDCIRCMYHGLKFDRDGQCIEAPAQDRVPAQMKVRSYPIVEKSKWVWVWMGDPARADEALIPQTPCMDVPGLCEGASEGRAAEPGCKDAGMAPAGSGAERGNRAGALETRSYQALTPETDTSTHYFFTQAHNFMIDKPEVTEGMYRALMVAFEEDRDMIGAQQRNLALDPDTPMISLTVDQALTQAQPV